MALDPIIETVGGLGNRLAQQHYATTTDLDGVLPWSPTDADRQKLVDEIGRAPTLEEEQAFEAGYRESMFRLDGNSRSPLLSAPFWHELSSVLSRYGYVLPPEGTPQRDEAKLLVQRLLGVLMQKLESFTLPGYIAPTLRQSDQQDAATSGPVPDAEARSEAEDG